MFRLSSKSALAILLFILARRAALAAIPVKGRAPMTELGDFTNSVGASGNGRPVSSAWSR